MLINQKKKPNTEDHEGKMKEREKLEKKKQEQENDGDINCSLFAWNGPQMFWKIKSVGIRNQRKNRDHSDYRMVKIDWEDSWRPEETFCHLNSR